MGGLLRGRQTGKETEGLRREGENQRERRGWRNALRSNGCLETVVKETMSPTVLWHLKCPIFMLILRKEEDFCLILLFPCSCSKAQQKTFKLEFIQHVQEK